MGRLPSLVWPLMTESAPLLPVSADLPLSVDDSVECEWPPLPQPSGHMDLMPLRSLPVDVPLLAMAAAAPPAAPTPAAPTGTPAQHPKVLSFGLGHRTLVLCLLPVCALLQASGLYH